MDFDRNGWRSVGPSGDQVGIRVSHDSSINITISMLIFGKVTGPQHIGLISSPEGQKMIMKIRIVAMAAISQFSGQAQALPVPPIHPPIPKIVKGGGAKETLTAGREAEGVAGSKGVEHPVTGDAARTGTALPMVEPKPDLAADIVAKSADDANTYKSLRASAGKGDASAMLKMSEMTASGRVSDPGEPWRGYWMFQAAKLGSKAAARKTYEECSSGESRRAIDRWFDSACRSADRRSH